MGCKADTERFASSTEALGETYARKVLNYKSDILGSDDVVNARKIVIQVIDGLRARRWMRSWNVPVGLSPVQKSQSHITHFSSN